ncbi:hypothetical protein PVAP13_2NG104800 [Panicum virgatum]|uniref:Uncharacterized protein n=1 Tax=Panicum virgatum TaxID=38727 RepID=A0A8T0V8I9_PANVG|nr:hypothetical protein PVAP13_2NG104800 [Panicum virgatum]
MDIATGAMNTLLPKLGELVVGEYNLQKGVKGEIKELEKELTSMTAALRKVSEVPPDKLDVQVKIWASDVRELSYDIEDAVDTFMLQGIGHEPTMAFSIKGFIDRTINLFKKAVTNHQIHNVIKDIMHQVKMVNERRKRYKVDEVSNRPIVETIDPRLEGMYRKATELVGIGRPKNELVEWLMNEASSSLQQPKIISIVGFGGLGKTTLANALLQDLKAKFDCHFFVSVSFSPDIKKIFKNILAQLDENKYGHIDESWEIKLLIDKIIEFLKNGRELLYKRIFESADDCPSDFSSVTKKILKKCCGVPLAIITTASLLATKPRCSVEWEKVNNSIGSGLENSPHVDTMNTILSLSYNDLPFHLKTCLLSLSKYPEDQVIRKDVLVWSWIAEGFIAPAGSSLQEIGEGYFNELINRSLIQPIEAYTFDELGEMDVTACRIHDMVLDLIVKLSAEEGFVTTSLSDDGEQAGASSLHRREIIRRLSLDNSSNADASINERNVLSKVRSLDVFGRAHLIIPALSRFRVLRVLQLDDCSSLDNDHLEDLCKLDLLRFLRLQGLRISKLPESIGKLGSLETLDIRGAESVILLPMSFAKLGKLVRLLAEEVELPDDMTLENMKSLQELVGICPTLHAMTKIAKLRELKVLKLVIEDESDTGNLDKLGPTSLPNLLQVLVLRTPLFYSLDSMAQVPSGLRIFMCSTHFTVFPRWIDPSLSHLTVLSICLWRVRVQPEHLDKLAELPSLRFLRIHALLPPREQEKLVIHSSPSAFPCLTELRIWCPLMFLKFQPGAMRKLERLCLGFDARSTIEHFRTSNFNYGFENLPSLRHVIIELRGREAHDDIRKTISNHPNHPSLNLS